MTDLDPANGQNEGMSVVAQATIEAPIGPRPSARRVCRAALMTKRMGETFSTGGTGFENRADEGETLLEFHEVCSEQELAFDITRLSRQ